MLHILTIIGARPQFIKAAAISRAIRQFDNIQETIVHTGQHFDANMSDIFFDEMGIPKPNYHLHVNSLSHGAMTGRMLEEIEKVLLQEKPDVVLVFGDTNSTLAGALAAKKHHIKIAHVEAGLRSFNMRMPEEVNRILTDRISDFLYCPTDTAVINLEAEGFRQYPCSIEQVGDVMLDAAMYYLPISSQKSSILRDMDLNQDQFLLVTIHRAENTDHPQRLAEIVEAINNLSKDFDVVFPVHPRTKHLLSNLSISPRVKLVDPVGYFDMIQLINGCRLVVTDSGGLQKEAYFFKRFCVTVRDQTEWVELVEHGYNRLSSTKSSDIQDAVHFFLKQTFKTGEALYGNGDASNRICRSLLNHHDKNPSI